MTYTPITLKNAASMRGDLTVTGGAPWTPASLPSLFAWYDASDAASIVSAGGLVSQWSDKKGTRHLTQGTGSLQPATGTRTQNGKNVIDFTASDDLRSGTAWNIAQPLTLCAVMKKDVAGTNQFFDSALGGDRSLWNPHTIYSGSSVAPPPANSTAAEVGLVVYNAASSKYQIDGTLYTSFGSPGTAGFGTPVMGGDAAGNFFDGFVAEFFACTGDQSASFTTIYNYFKTKWGTP
jgi:hypothetical protein